MGVDGGYFVIKYKDGMLHKVPKDTLESVAVFGNVNITVQCTREMLEKGISVSYLSAKGAYYGRLESTSHKNVFRLKSQVYLSDNDEFSLKLSKAILNAKINNQFVILRRYGSAPSVDSFCVQIKDMRKKALSADSKEELMGYEGAAAKAYFSGLSSVIDPEFAFNGRNRMPPRDPFNSMLSFGYTLLLYEIYAEITNKGLSPYCGFMHEDRERHPTLASDLMEEWRPVIVDSVTLSLIQGHEIHADQFTRDEETGGVYLTTDGMRKFLKKYEEKMRTPVSYIDCKRMEIRKCPWHQVGALTAAIENSDPDKYTPIMIR